MSENPDKVLKKIRPSRIILPVILGLVVVGYLFYKEFDPKSFSLLTFSWYIVLFVFVSLVLMVIRDFGYILRLKILSQNTLSWRKCFNIVMLWEFASAVTPGAIGGTSVAVVFIHKEGLSVGNSAAVVMATSLLDELYFILLFPIIVFTVGNAELFTIGDSLGNASFDFSNKYFLFAIIAYSVKFLWVLFMSYGLFINPKAIKNIIVGIFKLRFLKKWRNGANKTGEDLILASNTLKKQSFIFWIKAFLSTFFSWTARYWVLNFLLLALIFGMPNTSNFIPSFGENLLIFARQLVMWIIMVIMPTPGGSGIVELVFNDYMAEFIPTFGLVTLMALMWRIITYYPYLIIGVLVLPKWIKRVFSKNKKTA